MARGEAAAGVFNSDLDPGWGHFCSDGISDLVPFAIIWSIAALSGEVAGPRSVTASAAAAFARSTALSKSSPLLSAARRTPA